MITYFFLPFPKDSSLLKMLIFSQWIFLRKPWQGAHWGTIYWQGAETLYTTRTPVLNDIYMYVQLKIFIFRRKKTNTVKLLNCEIR